MDQEKQIRVIISGGGTGGHINPAIAIADEVRRRYPRAEFLFVGALGRMEMERIPAAGYKIVGLPVMGLDRKRLWRNFKVLRSLIQSRLLVRHTIQDFRPDVVVGVGGYASAPTLKEAQRAGIPTLLQEQNSYAGVTNKLLAKEACTICVAYPDMERFFPKEKIILTGNPVRQAIEENKTTVAEAEAYFRLEGCDAPTILVMGGSLGARSINESVVAALQLWNDRGYRIVWQTGKSFVEEARQAVASYEGLSQRAYVSAYMDRMDLAYRLADVVVSRAGACSISEICLSAKPAILVPSSNVTEDHQTKNARALSTRGAALLISDVEAATMVGKTIDALLDNPDRRRDMAAAARQMATPRAVELIVDELEKLIGRS